ncbi:MAG: elongation factor P maturation arginine rhamnosyltransferase EarP [Giesbergeria sp.]
MNALPSDPLPHWQWDVFCRVVDNFGDIGVCWRLAAQLAAAGQRVRLWVDDASALAWMAPCGAEGVQVRAWGGLPAEHEAASDVLIEAFGCDIPLDFIAASASRVSAGATKPVWINLEYLSAESWVARHHGLPSPVQHGPAAGWTKWFFYPGFTEGTGGLLREKNILQGQQALDPIAWRATELGAAANKGARWVSLFCYEPPAMGDWLRQCDGDLPQPTKLLVTPGRAQEAVRAAKGEKSDGNSQNSLSIKRSKLSILNISSFSQASYDGLLWACDLNFVRGEDSLVRALWAGKPFVWHIYPQDDGAHGPKLHAFLDWLQAPETLRRFHAVWNGLAEGPLPLVTAAVLQEWSDCVHAARAKLLQQNDLLSQLLGFCAAKR